VQKSAADATDGFSEAAARDEAWRAAWKGECRDDDGSDGSSPDDDRHASSHVATPPADRTRTGKYVEIIVAVNPRVLYQKRVLYQLK
jgi:hypothetical protein